MLGAAVLHPSDMLDAGAAQPHNEQQHRKRRRLSLDEMREACSVTAAKLPRTFAKAMKSMIQQTQLLRGQEHEWMLREIRTILDLAADDAKAYRRQDEKAVLCILQLYAGTAESDQQGWTVPATASPDKTPKLTETEEFAEELLAPSCIKCQWPTSACMCAMSAPFE